MLSLSRAFRERVRESEQVVGKKVISADIICTARGEVISSVDVVIERLVEAHTADIDAELHTMVSDNLAVVVGPTKAVSDLRQLALRIVADGKSARYRNEGKTFAIRWKTGMDSEVRVRGICEAILCRDVSAGGLHGMGILWVVISEFAFAEVRKMSLVDGGRIDCPCFGEIVLRVALVVIGPEAGH